jgi:hypothetical protein
MVHQDLLMEASTFCKGDHQSQARAQVAACSLVHIDMPTPVGMAAKRWNPTFLTEFLFGSWLCENAEALGRGFPRPFQGEGQGFQ